MPSIPYSAKFKRQRKFLLIAPAGAVVLLTILFASLGGGKGESVKQALTSTKGINVTLPAAHLKEDKSLNKTAYYKKAQLDSMNLREMSKRQGLVTGSSPDSIPNSFTHVDANEEKVKRQLADLRKVMGQATTVNPYGPASPTYLPEKRESPLPSPDIDRLERMLRMMKEGDTGRNPEMQELNKTLEGLLALQHPVGPSDTTVSKRTEPTEIKALPVNLAMAPNVVTDWKGETGNSNRFYDLDTNSGEEAPEISGIEAIIPETQTLVNGALLKLELSTELTIKGNRIPHGTPLYGIAHLNGERLMVTISSIHYQKQIYPVSLQVLDQDGLPGIYEPGSISRDAARESAGESIGGLGPASLDPSLGAQVANGAIQMARSLAGKKIRLIRVTVKSGYRVFLKDMSVTAAR